MARNVLNVIIDRVISLLRVKVRNDADDATWAIDSAGRGKVAVEGLKPDGTNAMPSGHDAGHAIFGKAVEAAPTDSCRLNPSFALTWTGGALTKIRMTAGGSSYDRTLTWSGNELESVGTWTAV